MGDRQSHISRGKGDKGQSRLKNIAIGLCVFIVVILALGSFSINYIFDRFIGNILMGEIDIDSILSEAFTQGLDDHSQGTKSEGESDRQQNAESNPVITIDQINEIHQQLSILEKAKAVRLLTANLSMEEIKEISSLAVGGVSSEEIDQVKELLMEKMTIKELSYLRDLYQNK